jgi:hypothetical protein
MSTRASVTPSKPWAKHIESKLGAEIRTSSYHCSQNVLPLRLVQWYVGSQEHVFEGLDSKLSPKYQ